MCVYIPLCVYMPLNISVFTPLMHNSRLDTPGGGAADGLTVVAHNRGITEEGLHDSQLSPERFQVGWCACAVVMYASVCSSSKNRDCL